MNASFAPPGAAWQEHRTPDGRVYYYNPLTKVTQWTKPEDLMTPAEVCLAGKELRDPSMYANLNLRKPARARKPAMEGVHR